MIRADHHFSALIAWCKEKLGEKGRSPNIARGASGKTGQDEGNDSDLDREFMERAVEEVGKADPRETIAFTRRSVWLL
jgi:hypothetical protein